MKNKMMYYRARSMIAGRPRSNPIAARTNRLERSSGRSARARDLAREIVKTEAYRSSRCSGKRSRCCAPTSSSIGCDCEDG
jgi:hypothetical protein